MTDLLEEAVAALRADGEQAAQRGSDLTRARIMRTLQSGDADVGMGADANMDAEPEDLLEVTTGALRAVGEANAKAEAGRMTRARVMRSLHGNKRRRHTRMAVLIPLAAIFIGGAAYASASGELPRMLDTLAEKVGLKSPTRLDHGDDEGLAQGSKGATPARVVEKQPEEVAEAPEEPVEEEKTPEVEEPIEIAAEPVETPAEKPVAKPVANEPAKPEKTAAKAPAAPVGKAPAAAAVTAPKLDGHALYQAAHQAHFSERNYSRALGAWERYLQAAPRGRFSTEAAYNRAICLVRLGRMAQGKAALKPFAEGRFGGYRQSEAQQLLDAL